LDTVAVPVDRYHSAAVAQTAKYTLVLVAGICVMLGAIYYAFHLLVGRRVAVVSKHFAEAARRGGDALIGRIDCGGNGEIRLLVAKFNRLTDKLRHTYASLEKRVGERTESLSTLDAELRREVAERQQTEQRPHAYAAALESQKRAMEEWDC